MKTEEQRLLDELYDRENRDITAPPKSFTPPTGIKYPDAKKHQLISFIKSGIRIAACFLGGIGYFEVGFFILGVAEVVGIVEELV